MCGGGCFCSVKTKLCSEEELKDGGKSKEMEEGRRIALAACSRRSATCLSLVVR